MNLKALLRCASLVACALLTTVARADFLASQAQPDGSYVAPGNLATPTQATAEAVRTLRLLGRGSEVAAADAYLVAEAYHGTEYLSRKIVAGVDSGNLDASLVTELLTHQNADGGFGESSGYDSNPLDTAFALDALTRSSSTTAQVAGVAVNYLLQNQGTNGSWSGPDGAPDFYTTALAGRALFPFDSQYAVVPAAVANATTYLTSGQAANGSWSSDFLSAQALMTLATVSTNAAAVKQGAAGLSAAQLADGSWSEDVYSTALALRALLLANQSAPINSATSGAIAGYVLSAQSNEPLSGATVTLSGGSQTTQTNSGGYFLLSGVPSGNYTVLAALSGYSSASVVGTVQPQQTSIVTSIILSQANGAAVVRGSVFDSSTQLPIAGAGVALSTGAASYSVTTASDGSFEFDNLSPGAYSVTFQANGYSNVTGSLSAPAGVVTAVRQGLATLGTFQDSSPGTLSGQVVDASSGQPLPGVTLSLNSAATATSAADGTFTFAAVQRGNVQILASAAGYVARTYSFVFAPGDSGNLGSLPLYPATGTAAATTLTVVGTVVDGIDGHPLAGASISVAQPGQTLTADATGAFTLTGLTSLSFNLTVSDAGYQTQGFSGTASGFGQVSGNFALTPASSSSGGTATSSILRGTVSDSVSQHAIAGALLAISGTNLTATSAADGSFEIDNIQPLSFTLAVSAAQYTARNYPINVTQAGTYALNPVLTPVPSSGTTPFQILAFAPVEGTSGANTVQHFSASVVNLQSSAQNAVVLADVIDGSGTTIATVSPYAPGTTTPTAQVSFPANTPVSLVIPWNTVQFAPGTYRLVLRIVQPGTVTRDLPTGVILTQADTHAAITATSSIIGQLAFNPPLSQAGSNTPVALSALIINSGNVPLTGTGFTLTIADPTSGATLTSAQVNATQIAVGNNTLLSFGSWTPTVAGNLPVTVTANDGVTQGTIAGTLYVGDKATGTFTVDRTVVPLGTQTVHATVAMQGVDATTATSTDPLFAAVKAAINKGGLFVGPQVRQWNQTNRCLGCHIQTQSLMGMSAAMNKADISPADVQYLYNDIAGSLESNGTILPAHTELPETQTALAIWALSGWQNPAQVFRTLYKGSVYQLSRMSTSGNQSWWNNDYCGIWVCNVPSQVMNSVKGLTATLRMAAQLTNTPVNDYTFVDSGQNLGERDVQGMQQTSDGSIWFTDASGNLSVHDPKAGTTRIVANGLGSPSLGLVVLPDGTAWVTSNTALTKVSPNGTTQRIPVPGSQWLWDMVQGPDGALYVADQYTSTIWRVTLDGTVSSFATGGQLNQPLSLSFDSSGNLLVANYGGWNIVQITPTGTMSVFSDGLPFQPAWLKRGPDGYLYAMTVQYSNYGYSPPGVFRIDSQGSVERLPLPFSAPNQYGFNSLAAINGGMCVNNGSDYHLYCLQVTQQDTSQLPAMLAALTGAVQYTLATYGDNGQWNDIHAMRLIALAEARTQITDTNLLGQIDTAIANIAALLRSRQSADGGWKYTTGSSASDPYATAFVGLALEYTNPSASDPVLRNAINFLLNSQQADGSWAPQTGPFTTKLGPASFVMAFMPKALDLLGGIDTGLNLTFPPSVQLANPSVAPTTESTASDGSTTYSWSLQGVTSEGRSVDFDLTLANMAYQEVRPVATAAYLGFANSFTNQTLTSNLTIPTVQAVGAVTVAVATDQASYPANAPVTITSTVTNAGASLPSGQIHVIVRAADETLISDLGVTAFGALATGASTTVPATFNTGTLLAGNYSVESQLLDQNSQQIGDSTTTFAIVAPTSTVIAGVTADKTSYQAWDTVTLTSRVQDVSLNAYQGGVSASITVQTPAGAALFQSSFSINSLAPGAVDTVPTTLHLTDAASGAYPVQLVLTDATTHNVITTVTTTFTVTRNTLQALSGTVTVQAPQLYQGVSELCSESVSNLSATALGGVTLTQQLVNLTTSQVVQTTTQTASFGAQQQQVFLNSVSTGPLALGPYACVVSASYQGVTQQIGSAGFLVVQPPIVINSSFGVGKKGRVLVLMDAEPPPPCGWLSEIELWAPFSTPLPANATVKVDLRDGSGKTIDTETLALASYRGTVNRNVGKGADLSITGLSASVLTVDIRGAGGPLPTGYRVVATVTAPSLPSMVVDSGSMGTQAGWPLVDGTHFGDFASVSHTSFGSQRDGAEDKHESRPTPEPDPSVERTFLTGLLQGAGLSYSLVTNADDFVTRLHDGTYSQFALLARHVELGSETRKELREAVFNGAGLLYAAQANGEFDDDDPSDFGFDDTFGIALNWGDLPASGVQLTTSTLSPVGSGVFAFEEHVACITRLTTAQVDGIFAGVPSFCKSAVTNNTYGNGKAVYVGYDLLAEATQAGNGSVHASLLTGALEYVSPAFGNSLAGHVVPLQLQLTNAGVAVPGQVQLPLPTGTTVVDPGTGSVTNGVLTWPFSLAVSQQLALNAWIELPDTAATATFVAQIQTGTSGNFTNYAQDTLTVASTANATLAQARAVAASSHAFAPVLFWLDSAQFWVDQKRPDCALASLLTATDYLLQGPLARTPDSGQGSWWPGSSEQGGATTAQVDALRWDIDQVIWTLSQNL